MLQVSLSWRLLQVAAAQTLYLSDDWYEKNNRVYSERREVVFEIMDLLKCSYDKNQVGMFVWAKIPSKYEKTVLKNMKNVKIKGKKVTAQLSK